MPRKTSANARELFESYLNNVFTRKGEGWVEKRLGDVCENLDSKRIPITKAKRVSGDIPYYGASGIVDYVADYIFDEDLLLVSEDGANLLARTYPIAFSISGKTWVNNHAHVLYFEEKYSQRFVEYYLNSISLEPFVSGMAQPKLNQKSLNAIPVPFPSLLEQKRIVNDFDALVKETKRLETIYQQKLTALAELKQSILQKAFAGELTTQLPKQNVISFPMAIPGISTTDLHAGILAIAYQRHETKGKTKTFGHVKAEKISHMIETVVGVDLGRNPVKDAAGPNDYPHLHKVGHRAEKAGYFSFKQSAGAGYKFHKHRKFDDLITRSRSALGEHNISVDKIIELMLPMDTKQAEIFATVYAAWNNLLIDGCEITNEAIVHEARENWHPDKLKIPRKKFFNAIEWIKEKDIEPEGKGKPVMMGKAKKRR